MASLKIFICVMLSAWAWFGWWLCPGQVWANEPVLGHQVRASASAQLYRPIRGIPVEPGTGTKRMLVAASLGPEAEEYYLGAWKRLVVLTDILESHWTVDITLKDMDELRPGFSRSYDIVMVVDEYRGLIDPWLRYELTSQFKGILVWSGYQSNLALTQLGYGRWYSQPAEEQLFDRVWYKGVLFDGREVRSFDQLPCPKADSRVEVLMEVEIGAGEMRPLACAVDERVFILPFELPYSYAVTDYSLGFLDLFHEIIEHHQGRRQALLRLEDVDPYTHRNSRYLDRVYKILKKRQIPFSMALIARYINPQTGLDLALGDRPAFQKLITKMIGEGLGTLVQHGYTHQYEDSVSGYGYEFWDDENDAPVKEDSVVFVEEKILAAKAIVKAQGLPVPDIWETPHYLISELGSEVVNRHYPLRYGDMAHLGSLPMTASVSGTVLLPENLGYVESVEDIFKIEEKLDKLRVFEDATASFFWHPWRDTWELVEMIDAVEEAGYTFVSVYDLVDPSPWSDYYRLEQFRQEYRYTWRQQITNVWIGLCFGVFSAGALVYIRNRLLIAKYLKQIRTCRISVEALRKQSRELGRKRLPQIAILVPARNEAKVIGNTVRRLARLDYPKDRYNVVVIVDAREKAEKGAVTTKAIVQRLAGKINRSYGRGLVRYMEVPDWFSGQMNDRRKTYGRSTKGRALNWALGQIKSRPRKWQELDMIGVVDADGRLDINVLKEVAQKRLVSGAKILQGPVFQVSNFEAVSLIGIAAGLELAIHHLTDLPHRLIGRKKNPYFLAGTNYFIDKNLLLELGGLDQTALIEDAELALRIFVEKGLTAEWLSWPEVEQTPANVGVYWRQRERWSMGHIRLLPTIMKAPMPIGHKLKFAGLVYFNMFRVLIDLGIPVLGWLLVFSGLLLDLGPGWKELSVLLLIMSVFIWDYYGMMYRTLISLKYVKGGRVAGSLALIVYMPMFIVLQALPRMSAVWKLAWSRDYQWYKTERTVEKYES